MSEKELGEDEPERERDKQHATARQAGRDNISHQNGVTWVLVDNKANRRLEFAVIKLESIMHRSVKQPLSFLCVAIK